MTPYKDLHTWTQDESQKSGQQNLIPESILILGVARATPQVPSTRVPQILNFDPTSLT